MCSDSDTEKGHRWQSYGHSESTRRRGSDYNEEKIKPTDTLRSDHTSSLQRIVSRLKELGGEKCHKKISKDLPNTKARAHSLVSTSTRVLRRNLSLQEPLLEAFPEKNSFAIDNQTSAFKARKFQQQSAQSMSSLRGMSENAGYLPDLAELQVGKENPILPETSAYRTRSSSTLLPNQGPKSKFSSDLSEEEEERVEGDTPREKSSATNHLSKDTGSLSPNVEPLSQSPSPSFATQILLDQEPPVKDGKRELNYKDLESYAAQERQESIILPTSTAVSDAKTKQEEFSVMMTDHPVPSMNAPRTTNAYMIESKAMSSKNQISNTSQLDFDEYCPISVSELESNESESLYSLDLDKNDFARSVQQKASRFRQKLMQERQRFSDKLTVSPSTYIWTNWKAVSPQSALPKSHLELSQRDEKIAVVEKQLGQMYPTQQSRQTQIQIHDEEAEQRRELRDLMPLIHNSGDLSSNPSLRELVEINQSLSRQVADAKAEKQALQRELKRVVRVVSEEESKERQFYKNQLTNMQTEVNRALDQVSHMHGEIARSESEKAQLKIELSNLQFELKTMASKTLSEKEREQMTSKQREEAINRERRDFERQVNEAQKSNEELKHSKEKEIGFLQKELSTAQGIIFSLRSEVEELRRKVTEGNIRYLKLTEQHSCAMDSYKKKLDSLTETKEKQFTKLEGDLRHEMEKKCKEQRAELERDFKVREGTLMKQTNILSVQLEECRLKLEQQARLQSTSERHMQTETTQRKDRVQPDTTARWGLAGSASVDNVFSSIGSAELWKEELKLLRDATQLAQQELKKERETNGSQAATIRCLEEKLRALITERAEETKAFRMAVEEKVKQECSKVKQQFQLRLEKEKAEARRLATEAVRRSLGPQLLHYKKSAAQAQKESRELRRRLEGFYDSVLKLTNKECRKLASVLQVDLERPCLLDTELAEIDNLGKILPTRSMDTDFSDSWEKSIATAMATQSAYVSELSALVKQLRRQLKTSKTSSQTPNSTQIFNRAAE